MRLLFFAGSTREGSFNRKLAALGHHIAEANGIEAVLVDLKDYPMPIYNGDLEAKEGPPEGARAFKALLGEYHGVFIASPEYNSSITPLLKNTLDWVTRVKAKGMPVLRSKQQGDLYIQVEVETPKNLSRKQRDLLKSFEDASNSSTSPASTGFFARVKEFFEGIGE